jgi:hypothetical protein
MRAANYALRSAYTSPGILHAWTSRLCDWLASFFVEPANFWHLASFDWLPDTEGKRQRVTQRWMCVLSPVDVQAIGVGLCSLVDFPGSQIQNSEKERGERLEVLSIFLVINL